MYIIGRKIKVNKKSEETCILEMTFGGHGEKHAGIGSRGGNGTGPRPGLGIMEIPGLDNSTRSQGTKGPEGNRWKQLNRPGFSRSKENRKF